MTGATHLFGPPAAIAARIRRRVRARGRAARSRSAPRGPSTWPRSRRRSPSPTGWSSSSPTGRARVPRSAAGRPHVGRRPGRRSSASPSAASGRSASSPARRRRPLEHLLGRRRGRAGSARSPSTTTRGASRRSGRARSVGAQSALGRVPADAASWCARCWPTSPTASPGGCGRSIGRRGPSASGCGSRACAR